MKNFGKLGGALLLVTLLVAFSAPAMADTMTFSGYGAPLSYSNNGMTVTSLQTHIHLDGTTLGNHSNCCSTPYRFDIGGGAFTLNNINVVSTYNFGDTFVSSNGGTVTLSSLGVLNFSGPGWTGITYFDWDHTGFGLTDIGSVTYNNTPEPGSLFLLGTGLLGMGGAVRRKFKI